MLLSNKFQIFSELNLNLEIFFYLLILYSYDPILHCLIIFLEKDFMRVFGLFTIEEGSLSPFEEEKKIL